eukprot:Phypoly_transcript_19753.p1 GENE.Phypoly_transcript_19753~~Phypoly_transcript_19753.p1  ORF type:complete len:136 (+),score=28.82 Phypoly_transcript_19753:71-478(+)
MNVKQANAGLVTNFEVYTQVHTRKGTTEMGEYVMKFKEKVHTYLSTTPAVLETTEGVTECFKYLDKFELTKAEKLQVVNLAPNTDVDVHAIIEDCPERIPAEGVEELIYEIQQKLFPTHSGTSSSDPPPESSSPV